MFRKVYRILYRKFWNKLNPIKYAKKIGVNFKEMCRIYGNVDWGTEPWIITIGENVYITDNIKFITHDGGTLLFRKDVPDLEITKPIDVGDDVYIGNDVIICQELVLEIEL